MADSVAWSGLLGVLVDPKLDLNVQIRSFGSFEGTVPDPEELKPLILEGVRRVALAKTSYFALTNHEAEIAEASQASIAIELREMGVTGRLSITAFSISEQDHKLLTAAVAAAMPRR
jgi:hypothetical protein